MKFLCVACDEPMKLERTESQAGSGSLSVVYACPSCDQRMAMLTNPAETQLVQSLGIRIGPAGGEQAGGGCPFSGMLAEMAAKGGDGDLAWTPEALARLDNVPEMVRPMARQGVEHYARSQGRTVVDEAVMEEARGTFGM